MAVTVFSWHPRLSLRNAHIDKCITDRLIHCSDVDCVAPRCAALHVVCTCQDGRVQAQTWECRSGCESGISDSSSLSEIDEEEFQETESSDVSSESGVTQVKM